MEVNHPLQEATSNFWKSSRLRTFENWPFQSDCACTPERMAAAGFVLIGGREEPDLVECFVCSKQLDDWDAEDDPWSEHVKHMPSCTYVKIGKQNELDWTIPELFKLREEFAKKSLKQKYELAVSQMKKEMAEMAKQIPAQPKKVVRKSRKRTS